MDRCTNEVLTIKIIKYFEQVNLSDDSTKYSLDSDSNNDIIWIAEITKKYNIPICSESMWIWCNISSLAIAWVTTEL